MNKMERQYNITKNKIITFEEEIGSFENANVNINPILYKAQISGLNYQLSMLEEEVYEYEKLKQHNRYEMTMEEYNANNNTI